MELAVIIAVIFAGIVFYSVYSTVSSRKRRAEQIAAEFGLPPQDTDYELGSIRRYASFLSDDTMRVDNITWNDLDMDTVYKRINVCNSSVGEEYLYNTLQSLPLNAEHTGMREKIIEFFDTHPTERLKVQSSLAGLGKKNYNGIATMIFNTKSGLLPRQQLYKVLAAVPVLFIVLMPVNLTAGVVGLFMSFIVNMIAHFKNQRHIDMEMQTISYFSRMMYCVEKLLKANGLEYLPGIMELKRSHDKFKSANNRAPIQKNNSGDLVEMFFTYFDILFLISVRGYNRLMSAINAEKESFHSIYRILGEIDVSICLLSFRKSLPEFCLPEFHDKNAIVFDGIYHPLLNEPVTNSGTISNDSLITGSNASGKSTFIKTLAINGILSQTINTCTAQKFVSRHSIIATSMVMRDDLQSGDSYFIVEIKSLKRILDLVKLYPCTCYVDEILRGTNTIERIAASASVLEHLYNQDCLCVAASHDIELTYILPYDNYNFSERITDNEIIFDYTLNNGPSTTRNAIKLLHFAGFDSEIADAADRLAGEYDVGKTWRGRG